jgi:ribonucleoside-diphosphate reductase alpha chain
MKIYNYKDSLVKSKEYFKGDDLAAKVFLDKYALRNSEGEIIEDTPDKMHRRLAKEFARIEKKYKNPMSEEEIYSLIDNFKYIIPQGSPMSAIGNPYHIQSSGNCFSIEPPYDSYGGIFYTDQQLGQLMKRRCGVGLCLNNLRPKGAPVKNAAKTTDGIEVFMERFSNTCREVAQNGRRGAEIQLLSIHHPEIKTFINIKRDKKKITGANISIQATNEFLNAVKKGDDFELRWPVDSKKPVISQKISAREIWKEFINSSHNSAEPGLLYWDNIIKNSVSNDYGKIDKAFYDTACNPCGEIVMGADSCRLLAINLYSFVENKFKKNAYFDFKLFAEISQKAQRMMDDMVDLEIELIKKILNKIESDPEPKHIKKIEEETWTNILEVCKKGRRTGLGITGLGDTLASLNIIYGSKKSITKTGEIYKTLCINAYKSTCILSKERGSFPIYSSKIEKNNNFINKVIKEDKELKKIYDKYGRRNIALTTTPPAGSISLLAQVSSGIEPVFSVKSIRRKKIHDGPNKGTKVDFIDHMGDKWQEFEVFHKGFKEWQEVTGKIKIEDSPYYKATSKDIDWIASVDIQAEAQKWICHSISKTCNLPNNATKELVEKVFLRAWEKGCKGFTIYREGCRTGVILDANSTSKKETKGIQKNSSPKRPRNLPCDIFHVSVKGEPFFVIVGTLYGEPYEVFAGKNGVISRNFKEGIIRKRKRGSYILHNKDNDDILHGGIGQYITDEQETITRLISSSLRHGCDVGFVVHQLEKTTGDLMGFSKAVSRVLKKYIKEGAKVHGEECPECENKLIRAEGCLRCSNCSWSKCG